MIDLIELFISLSSNFNLGGISYILFILFFSHLRWYAELVEILIWQFLWHFYLESSFLSCIKSKRKHKSRDWKTVFP